MDIDRILKELTLEEKASLCSGKDFWTTKSVERLGVPSWMMTDGPHGLRKQTADSESVGLDKSVPATCFPSGVTLASSWDRELLQAVGQAIGEEARAEGVGVLLGPAINIKRSPLCGRNFEYFSEDPYLAGELAVHHIRGVQSRGVGACVKHFAANNQETHRNTIDTLVDERTLREIYLRAFERAVKEGRPWTIMAAYNKLNGQFCSEHPWLLQELLRDEWGFDGVVMTDWGACNDRVAGLKAGQDLEMPGSRGMTDREIVAADRSGQLDEAVLDHAVRRLLALTTKMLEGQQGLEHGSAGHSDRDAHHDLARQAAREGAVLLKNDGPILPLKPGQRVAFIGAFARQPRYQGGGSSHITPSRLDTVLDALKELFPGPVPYAEGYRLEHDQMDPVLIDEAVKLAQEAEIAVLFLGLTDHSETEGVDRTHLRLPESHEALLRAVRAVQKQVVVVLSNGSPVEMPWIDEVPAVLETYLGGQAWGAAVVDLLYGRANPCGKLAESFPLRLEDTPCYLNFPGERRRVEYREGLFVGYRYYTSVGRKVLFPFGHGLSYSRFEYSNLTIDRQEILDTETVHLTVDVTNRGPYDGKEVVQLYVLPPRTELVRPVQELKGFAKIALRVGETRQVSFTLDRDAFAYWSIDHGDWVVASGLYEISIGSSSEDLRLKTRLTIRSTAPCPYPLTMNSTLAELEQYEEGRPFVESVRQGFIRMFGPIEADNPQAPLIQSFIEETPLRSIVRMVEGLDSRTVQELLDRIQKKGNIGT